MSSMEKLNRFLNGARDLLPEVTASYVAWIVAHHVSTRIYSYMCTPQSVGDVLVYPFMVSAPHCKGILWLVNASSDTITTMWVTAGTWVVANVFRRSLHRPNQRQTGRFESGTSSRDGS